VADVTAPMGGKIIKLSVAVGDSVAEDDEVAILEAMKMEMPIMSPADGEIKEVKVAEGDAVDADQVLMVIA
jgi:acetyl-CoA carboxylase biotin carboxyl carrier protein